MQGKNVRIYAISDDESHGLCPGQAGKEGTSRFSVGDKGAEPMV